MSDWIEFRDDRNVHIPNEGYVQIEDFFDGRLLVLNCYQEQQPLLWNRVAPSGVKKFRYITKEEYLFEKIKSMAIQLKEFEARMGAELGGLVMELNRKIDG